jgi:hypothetical protein
VRLKDHIYCWMAEECERRAAETDRADVRIEYLKLGQQWRSLVPADSMTDAPGRTDVSTTAHAQPRATLH